MKQAYYSASLKSFLAEHNETIAARLNERLVDHAQAWTIQLPSWKRFIEIAKEHFKAITNKFPEAYEWIIILEYEIPRLLSRIDAVMLAKDLIFVIEFKFDRKTFEQADIRQVEDYALDLKDFHYESRNRQIVPILLSPLAPTIHPSSSMSKNLIADTIKCNAFNFGETILTSFQKLTGTETIDANKWINSSYSPTPTIIQAAQALFAGQKVEAIATAGAENLSVTTDYISQIIDDAKSNNKKVVCFVTGVPGSGKTLVGLNIIHKQEYKEENGANAAYFSGNGPLIKVLREALVRDEWSRSNTLYKNGVIERKPLKNIIEKKVESKIQNLHQFIKDGSRNTHASNERIVVFDEAQRCWNADKFYNASVQSRIKEDNPIRKSEAEFIFEIMDRHNDWAVIIALVGNGQEINTGEAGISEWGNVLKTKYPHWQVCISNDLLYNSANFQNCLFSEPTDGLDIIENSALHLKVSHRSFKANNLNDWVTAVINNHPEEAAQLYNSISRNYPIFITRDLAQAKEWLRRNKRGNKRIGLVASSGALRLRSHGINTREDLNVPYWFLNDENDVRSSYYLEVVATEYKIQGLEIDWIGLCWDADLRRDNKEWIFRSFSGTSWDRVNALEEQQFLINKYRVLLTRAREGMVIWIPEGDINDWTRLPEIYDPIYDYLLSCGVQKLST